jgi:hypothetical protein
MTSPDALPAKRRFAYTAMFACSVLTCVVVVVFFFIGLGDGSVSSFNLGLWLVLLCVSGLSLWAGHALHAREKHVLALVALAVTAVPGVLAGLFLLLILITQPRWN